MTETMSERRRASSSSSQQSEDPEDARPTRPPSPRQPEGNAPPPSDEVTTLRMTAHYAGLVLASMVGCLIRLGLEGLCTYDGMVIYSLAWAQGVGCGIMGLALARKNEIIAWYPPLYTFWTTGVAGSVTTFSSWMLESYLAFSNFEGYNRKGLHDTVDGLAYCFSTFAISIGCLMWGEYISTVLPSIPPPSRRRSILNGKDQDQINLGDLNPTSTTRTHRHRHRLPTKHVSSTPAHDILYISTAFAAYLIALLLYFLGPDTWRHRATFPILLSPPGAILRFALARLNTKKVFMDKFPVGTFLANIIATLLISAMFVLQRPNTDTNIPTSGSAGVGALRCSALYAVQQGFCGCLSTVSTFVVESRTVRGWWRWVYIGGSILLGHLVVLAIVGGISWTRGFGPVCQG